MLLALFQLLTSRMLFLGKKLNFKLLENCEKKMFFSWNAAIALAVGNTVLWKGAPTTPLVSIATTRIVTEVLKRNNLPTAITLCQGGVDVGKKLVADERVKLVSFTGSTKVGREVGVEVQRRFGKLLLELGGNNALLINDDADFDMALDAAFFGCIGTAGQRCKFGFLRLLFIIFELKLGTSTRRLIIHEKLYDAFLQKLVQRYKGVSLIKFDFNLLTIFFSQASQTCWTSS